MPQCLNIVTIVAEKLSNYPCYLWAARQQMMRNPGNHGGTRRGRNDGVSGSVDIQPLNGLSAGYCAGLSVSSTELLSYGRTCEYRGEA